MTKFPVAVFSLSPRRPGVEGWVWGADRHTPPLPTSPSHASGAGPSLSPLKGGEGLA
jgi:hypothetical protein